MSAEDDMVMSDDELSFEPEYGDLTDLWETVFTLQNSVNLLRAEMAIANGAIAGARAALDEYQHQTNVLLAHLTGPGPTAE